MPTDEYMDFKVNNDCIHLYINFECNGYFCNKDNMDEDDICIDCVEVET